MTSDTTPAAWEAQRAVWRRLDPDELRRMVIAKLYGIDQAKLSLPS